MTAREDREKEKTSRENLGKFFYDLAKANFTTNVAGCILSMVMKEKYDDAMVWGLLSFGLASTAILAYVGFRILKNKCYGRINYDLCDDYSRCWGYGALASYKMG